MGWVKRVWEDSSHTARFIGTARREKLVQPSDQPVSMQPQRTLEGTAGRYRCVTDRPDRNKNGERPHRSVLARHTGILRDCDARGAEVGREGVVPAGLSTGGGETVPTDGD